MCHRTPQGCSGRRGRSAHVPPCFFSLWIWDYFLGWMKYFFYGFTLETAEARGVYLVSYVRLILVNVISQEALRGNFFKLGTNVLLDSWMNWLDVGGQRSKVTLALAPSRSRDQHILWTPEENRRVAASFSGWNNGAWDGRAGWTPNHRGEDGAEPEGEALSLPVRSSPVGTDPENKMVDTSGRNECPPYGGWAQIRSTASLCGKVRRFWH